MTTVLSLGEIICLSRSFMSRLFSGESRDMSDPNFLALLRVFSNDPQAQADLIAARCMDARHAAQAPGIAGAELVEIRVKAGSAVEKPEPEYPQVPLGQEAERAFAWLRSQCPINPDLEQHLIGYAKLTGMK